MPGMNHLAVVPQRAVRLVAHVTQEHTFQFNPIVYKQIHLRFQIRFACFTFQLQS